MAGYLEAIELLRQDVESVRRGLAEKEAALRLLERMEAERKRASIVMSVDEHTGVTLVSGIPVPQRAPTLMEQVEGVARKLSQHDLTVQLVESTLAHEGVTVGGKYPRSRISTALNDLASSGVLVRTFEGRGNVPHRYRLASAAQDVGPTQTEIGEESPA